MNLGKYRKFIVALVGVILVGLETFLEIELPYTAPEMVNVLITLATAGGVYMAPNDGGEA